MSTDESKMYDVRKQVYETTDINEGYRNAIILSLNDNRSSIHFNSIDYQNDNGSI